MSTGVQFGITDPYRNIPNAKCGIFAQSHLWHNNGDYYDHVTGFGYNLLQEQPDDVAVGLSVESHYAQGLGSEFGSEMHLACTLPDGRGSRVFTAWVGHTTSQALAGISGELTFTDSHGGDLINGRVREGGGTQWWAGTGVTNLHDFYSRKYTDSMVGGGGIRISPSDRYPSVEWMGGVTGGTGGHYATKVAAFLDQSPEQNGWFYWDLRTPGAEFHVRGAKSMVIENGAIQTVAPTGGTAKPWKLGSIVPTAVTFDTTRSVMAEIDGVLVKLAVCQ